MLAKIRDMFIEKNKNPKPKNTTMQKTNQLNHSKNSELYGSRTPYPFPPSTVALKTNSLTLQCLWKLASQQPHKGLGFGTPPKILSPENFYYLVSLAVPWKAPSPGLILVWSDSEFSLCTALNPRHSLKKIIGGFFFFKILFFSSKSPGT